MKLLYHPNQSLKIYCQEVKTFDAELHKILDEMQKVMLEEDGMGLAANQIGLDTRIFLMKDKKNKVWEFINPIIVFEDDVQYINEGCLSFPGITIQVKRAKQVSVKAKDRNGEEFHIGATDLEAVCIQHEIDHLNGVTFIDNLSRQQRRDVLRKIKK